MEKYPVISENGNEYLVDVHETENIYWHDSIEVVLYKYEDKVKGIFKKKIVKSLVYITTISIDKDIDELYEAYRRDFVQAAKESIKSYEDSIEKKRIEKIEREQIIKNRQEQFEKWDGRC